jgi:hypothetical protein
LQVIQPALLASLAPSLLALRHHKSKCSAVLTPPFMMPLQSALDTISKLEQQQQQQPEAAVEQAGFDEPSAAAAAAASEAGEAAGAAPVAAQAAAPAPVKDLGVVGRGTKRLNLAPVQVSMPVAGMPSAVRGHSGVPKHAALQYGSSCKRVGKKMDAIERRYI